MDRARRTTRLLAGAALLAFLTACTDGSGPLTGPDDPSADVGPDDPNRAEQYIPDGLPHASLFEGLEIARSDGILFEEQTITFDAAGADPRGETFKASDPRGTAFVEGDFQVTAFWFSGGRPLPGHFHFREKAEEPGDFFEAHHHQGGTFARQGIVIRRADGGPFSLLSIDVRTACTNPGGPAEGSPLEVGTVDPTEAGDLSSFVEVETPDGGAGFETVEIPGFENVTEVWITQFSCGDWDDVLVEPLAPFIEVEIDIKPGSDENPINLKNRGVIPVALLTTSVDDGESVDFDASDADPATLTLGDDEGDETPVAERRNGTLMAEPEDVDDDGDLDLILHFPTQELVESGDLDEEADELFLNGETLDGTPLVGSDVVTIPPGSDKGGGPPDDAGPAGGPDGGDDENDGEEDEGKGKGKGKKGKGR